MLLTKTPRTCVNFLMSYCLIIHAFLVLYWTYIGSFKVVSNNIKQPFTSNKIISACQVEKYDIYEAWFPSLFFVGCYSLVVVV